MIAAWVLVAIGALVGPLVYQLFRTDGPATAAVHVSRRDFELGDLPSVCTKTGAAVSVNVHVAQRRRGRRVVGGFVPMSSSHHESFLSWKQLNRRAGWLTFPMTVLSVPLGAQEGPPGAKAALFVVVFFPYVFSLLSNLIAHRHLVEPTLKRDGSVLLRGVHPAFVRAVQEARRRDALDQSMTSRP